MPNHGCRFFFNRRLKRFKNREGQQISVILERPDILFVLNSSYKLTGLLPMTTAIGYGAQLLMVEVQIKWHYHYNFAFCFGR